MKKPSPHPTKKSTSRIYIDQSGKVEGSKQTVIAFTNGKKSALMIKAKDKRVIQKLFRKAGRGRVFVFRLFSFLVFLLIKDLKFDEIIIDIEYQGKSDLIRGYIVDQLRKYGKSISASQISFREIGKKCEAHWHSYYVFTGKRKPEKVITLQDIPKELFK